MEREWISPVDGRRYRVGTAEDAGRICGLGRRNGYDPKQAAHQYRRMVRKPPKTYSAPPGPIDLGGAVLTDPVTGEYLYDLDAVELWQGGRPGRGRWRPRFGWGYPSGEGRKAHYFPALEGRSLCGRFDASQLDPYVHLVSDDGIASTTECVVCRRRLDESRGGPPRPLEAPDDVADLATVG